MRVVGVDEAGRGCWAGPVVAAAVYTNDDAARSRLERAGVGDSKTLSPAKRAALYDLIRATPGVFVSVGVEQASRIDEINIRQATHAAMTSAAHDVLDLVARHPTVPASLTATVPAQTGALQLIEIRIDGNDVPVGLRGCGGTIARAIVGGDGSDVTIGAASIIAKVLRDRVMIEADAIYPGYGFAKHKAYGTPAHTAALARLGPCAIHRFSYRPIKKLNDGTPPPARDQD